MIVSNHCKDVTIQPLMSYQINSLVIHVHETVQVHSNISQLN